MLILYPAMMLFVSELVLLGVGLVLVKVVLRIAKLDGESLIWNRNIEKRFC